MMRKMVMRKMTWSSCFAAVIAAALLAVPAFGQEHQIEVEVEVNHQKAGAYWIGVLLEPVGDLAKSQLNIEHGLAVGKVVDDGPAAKAGLQENDVLLTFDGQPAADLEGLAKMVNAAQGREVEVEVLRGGKRQTIKLTPGERPAKSGQAELKARHALDEWRKAFPLLKEGEDDDVWFFRPGVLLPEEAADIEVPSFMMKGSGFPANTRVEISKQGEEPVKITVHQNEQTWTVDESGIDQLPEEVRGVVERALGRMKLSSFQLDVQPLRLWVEKHREAAEEAAGPVKKRLEERREQLLKKRDEIQKKAAEAIEQSEAPRQLSEAVKNMEQALQSLQKGGALERIERQLKELRRDVDQLKQQSGEDRKADDDVAPNREGAAT